jgi:hypothetical protein
MISKGIEAGAKEFDKSREEMSLTSPKNDKVTMPAVINNFISSTLG